MIKKSIDKKELILKAAHESFIKYGYDKTTLDDIAKAVRLNKASLYYYYKSKDEIFFEFARQISREERALLKGKVEAIDCPEEKIIAYLTGRLVFYRNMVVKLQLSAEKMQFLEPRLNQSYLELKGKEKQYLIELLQPLNRLTINADEMAEVLITLLDGLKYQAFIITNKTYADEVDYSASIEKLKFLVRLLINGLKDKIL